MNQIRTLVYIPIWTIKDQRVVHHPSMLKAVYIPIWTIKDCAQKRQAGS